MRLGRVGQGHERENVVGIQQGVRKRASWVDTDLSTWPQHRITTGSTGTRQRHNGKAGQNKQIGG